MPRLTWSDDAPTTPKGPAILRNAARGRRRPPPLPRRRRLLDTTQHDSPMAMRETAALPLVKADEQDVLVVDIRATQALPLVRRNDSERHQLRRRARRVGWLAVAAILVAGVFAVVGLYRSPVTVAVSQHAADTSIPVLFDGQTVGMLTLDEDSLIALQDGAIRIRQVKTDAGVVTVLERVKRDQP